jgi:hypothetical protein
MAKVKALRPWYKKKRFIGLVIIAGITVILTVSRQGGDVPTSTDSDADSQVSEDGATEDTVGTGLGSKDASGDIDHCGTPDAIGVSYPSVKVTNRSEKRSNYFVTVSFESSDGSTKYDETIIIVMSLNPGQSMTEEGMIANEIPDGAICKVTEVQRTSDE